LKITENQPLVSNKIPTTQLQNDYATDDKIYQDKVAVNINNKKLSNLFFDYSKELIKKYKFIRRTRGDGNCFYRAFAFGYLEKNLNNTKELERFRQLTYDLKDQLVKLGYLEFTLEDVRDVVIEIIDNIRKEADEKSLIENFCSALYSEYFVAYLR
jgi:ubiquitin thioesterase protein OTUB1